MQVKKGMLYQTIIEIEATSTYQESSNDGRTIGLCPTPLPTPKTECSPQQQQSAKGMKKAIAKKTSMLIGIPVKGVPLQQLVQEGLVQKGHDANTQYEARPEDGANRTPPAQWFTSGRG
jgi:hypothetical protein